MNGTDDYDDADRARRGYPVCFEPGASNTEEPDVLAWSLTASGEAIGELRQSLSTPE